MSKEQLVMTEHFDKDKSLLKWQYKNYNVDINVIMRIILDEFNIQDM